MMTKYSKSTKEAVLAVLLVISVIWVGLEFQPSKEPPKVSPRIYAEEHFTLQDGTPCVVIRYNPQALTTLGISCNYSLGAKM